MLDTIFYYLVKRPLYSGIYTDTWEDIGDGGPTCFKELTVQFRVVISIVMTIFQYSVLQFALKQVQKKYGNVKEADDKVNPHKIELVFGWISIFVFICQIFYKIAAGKGIFMINPCHVVLLMQAYVLTLKKSLNTQVMYANCVSLLFSPWCGMLFAVDIGLTGPFEKQMYWIEHYLGAIINPLVLAMSGRYHQRKFFHVYYRLIGFAFFSLYHRVVLLPLAFLTWANLDQTLCHAETDPFYRFFGDWYYLMADFYIPIASYLVGYSYLFTCEIVAWLKSLIVTEEKVEIPHKQVKAE
jgi:hypothetical protein